MATVEFSPLAKKDLEDIIVYVAEHNISSAQKIVKELMGKFKLLAENPKIGSKRIISLSIFGHFLTKTM